MAYLTQPVDRGLSGLLYFLAKDMLRTATGRIARVVIDAPQGESSRPFLDVYIDVAYEEVRAGFSWKPSIPLDAFLLEVMRAAGVSDFKDLSGRVVRVKIDQDDGPSKRERIVAIGHETKEEWLWY
jgi:hypothetical protein